MTDVTNPNTETVTNTTQAVVQPDTQTPPTPPAEVEEFDKDRAMNTIRNLREFEKKAKPELKELEQMKAEQRKRAEAEMTEAQRLQKQLADTQAENARIMSDLWRREAADAAKLPSEWLDRIKGTTKEELLEDAKKLAEILPKQKPTPPHIDPTNPPNGQPAETEAQKRERLFGRQSNIFDMEAIKNNGGGVVWVSPEKGAKK